MFVISTNVAETSLPIPNIKYVVDSGKEKKKVQIYKNKTMLATYYTSTNKIIKTFTVKFSISILIKIF